MPEQQSAGALDFLKNIDKGMVIHAAVIVVILLLLYHFIFNR
jgi:hypothetical protein